MIILQTFSSFAVCYCNPFGLEASGERWMLVVGGVGSGGLLRHGLERKPLFFLRIVQSHRQLWATAIAYLQCGKKILVVVWAFYLSILSSGSPFILVHFSFSFYFIFWAEQCLWTYLWHSIISKADYGTGSDRSRFIRNEYCSFSVVFLSPRLAYMNLQMNPICSQVSFGSVFYSAPVSFTLPSSPPIPRKVKTTNNTLQNLCI